MIPLLLPKHPHGTRAYRRPHRGPGAALSIAGMALLLAVAACRPSRAVNETIPAPGGVPLPASHVAAPAPTSANAAGTNSPRAVFTSVEDLTRTVVSVFGDSAALHHSDVPVEDEAPSWDIDVRSYEAHERVAHYVKLFSTGSRERFSERLSRGTRYEPMIRAKLRAGGMPEDLTYLALIESGYDPHAYSRAAAVGMWQFMSTTARAVGLRVDWWVDERRDPVRATEGAIRFLRDLQSQFGSLYLAAAAYNGGPGRVARGLTRYAGALDGTAGEDVFFALAEQDYLRDETKNYVPQIIAAALVAKQPAQYGLQVDTLTVFAYDSVLVDAGTSLAAVVAASGGIVADVRDLNPALLRGMVPPTTSMWLHVPVGAAARTGAGLATMPDSLRAGARSVTVTGATTTLASLASRHGVLLRQLAWFNPGLKTRSKGRLVSGQTVRIPSAGTIAMARSVPDPSIERYGGSTTASLSRRGVHIVRRGESLGAIARKYGLTLARLKSLNGVRTDRIIAGQALRVSDAARTVSSTRTTGKATVKPSVARKSTATLVKKTRRKSAKAFSIKP